MPLANGRLAGVRTEVSSGKPLLEMLRFAYGSNNLKSGFLTSLK